VNEYQIIREKAASQKRDVERALTRFIAKTGETQSLIRDEANLFPCKRAGIIYQVNPINSFKARKNFIYRLYMATTVKVFDESETYNR
jgi:hypothetical protein